jgi:hypothetical protein
VLSPSSTSKTQLLDFKSNRSVVVNPRSELDLTVGHSDLIDLCCCKPRSALDLTVGTWKSQSDLETNHSDTMSKFQPWENYFLMISSKNYLLNFKQKIQTIE